MMYREKPLFPWEEDTQNYYLLGLDKRWPYSNKVRSLKEHIFIYRLCTADHSGLSVHSDGSLACRFDRIDGKPTLIVNGLWDYNNLKWGNYSKKIPLKKELSGHVTLVLSGSAK